MDEKKIEPTSYSMHNDRRIVAVCADPDVAQTRAIRARHEEPAFSVRVFMRQVKAGGCLVRVHLVVVMGRKNG